MGKNNFKFEKRLKAGFAGYSLLGWGFFKDRNNQKMQINYEKHYFNSDYKKPIPQSIKQKAIEIMTKKINKEINK